MGSRPSGNCIVGIAFALVISLVLWLLVLFLVWPRPLDAAQAGSTWGYIADCESGAWDAQGRPIPWSRNFADRRGGYEGGFHFAPGTWDAFRAPDMPDAAYDAHVFAQVWVAERVLAAQGWRAWPVCSRKAGLR